MQKPTSNVAAKGGLEIFFELSPEVAVDRVPMRKAVLHFKNTSDAPLRVYVPSSEPFRGLISTLYFRSGGHVFLEPEPQPHGYVVTEVDFPELAPHSEKTFTQSFTIDPLGRAAGAGPERRKGFERGTTADVSWTYENTITRWAGGIQTLDGPTKALFDGGTIPGIWTGKLTVQLRWVIAD